MNSVVVLNIFTDFFSFFLFSMLQLFNGFVIVRMKSVPIGSVA